MAFSYSSALDYMSDRSNYPQSIQNWLDPKAEEALGSNVLDPESALSYIDLQSLLGQSAANQEFAIEQAQKQMDFQTSANQKAMDFSAEQGELQRAWLEQMSNSSYQRATEDMQKAGLNPILAYSQGGASTPSVSAASGISSSGAKAEQNDLGYDVPELMVKLFEIEENNSTKILSTILSRLIPNLSLSGSASTNK